MATPSQAVKVPTYKKVIKVRKPVKKEPKNIFQHMSDGLGINLMGGMKKQKSLLEIVKNILLSLGMFLAVGYILGTILDIYLGTGVLGSVFALVMFLIWLLKKGGKYLWEKM